MRRSIALISALILVLVGLVSTPAAASDPSSDATLQGLVTRGYDSNNPYDPNSGWLHTAMANFSPTQGFYDLYSVDQIFQLYVRPNDGQTVSVSTSAGDVPLITAPNSYWSGFLVANVTVDEAPGQIVSIIVTAPDGVSQMTYRLKVSTGANIARPRVISNSLTSISTLGGTQGVVYMENWTPCTTFSYDYNYVDSTGNTQHQRDYASASYLNTDSNGVTKISLQAPGSTVTFRDDSLVANFEVENDTTSQYSSGCPYQSYQWWNSANPFTPWVYAHADETFPNAIHFFNDAVTSTTMPDTVSQDGVFVVSGPGITSQKNNGTLEFQLFNPATGNSMPLEARPINNSSVQLRVPYYYSFGEWNSEQNLVLTLTEYAGSGVNPQPQPLVIYSKPVKFTPEMATAVSVSPAKGPITGGNKVTISGHGICNAYGQLATITIGGNGVTNLTLTSSNCNFSNSSNKTALDGIDTATFNAPAGIAGPADITVDMGYGPTTLSQKYIYGAAPTVSSIAPTSVANTGGSIITLTGTNFGVSGTPVVIIDGQKSPYVSRLSPTKVRAMVPASSTLGPVAVNILSSSGGGGLSQLASITYTGRGADPAISSITPSSGALSGGNTVVISGSGFSATASGVLIGGAAAKIISATANSITAETPANSAIGSVDVTVATPTGLVTVSNAFTYVPDPGVSSVSPSSIASTATGADATITITGAGFGSSGKITIGSNAAIDYTSSAAGTLISGVAIPTDSAGPVALSILPAGATKPFTTSVTVTAPQISFFGPKDGGIIIGEGTLIVFGDNDPWTDYGYGGLGVPLAAANNSGDVMQITGSGFGTSGHIQIGSTTVSAVAYSDSEIEFVSPSGLTAGTYDLTVVPSSGTLVGSISRAVTIGAQLSPMQITSVNANTAPSFGSAPNHFWPNTSDSDLYTITGVGFNGTDSGSSTRVYMQGFSDFWANSINWQLVSVVSKSDTSIVIRVPRNLDLDQWNALKIVTNRGSISLAAAVYFDNTQPSGPSPSPSPSGGGSGGGGSSGPAPRQSLSQSSYLGLCTSGLVGRTADAVSFTNSSGIFGADGHVTIGGVTIDSRAVYWASDGTSVSVDFAAAGLTNVWGSQTIEVAPNGLDPQDFSFECAVDSTVTTSLNGQDANLTIQAGDSLSPSSNLNDSLPATTWTEPASNYEYQTAADRAANRPYTPGLPQAAGEYYVRARIDGAQYDNAKYHQLTPANSVHLVIQGRDITVTPRLGSGGDSSIVYRGQLGNDLTGTGRGIGLSVAPFTSDAITDVSFEYRNHGCTDDTIQNTSPWVNGLPKDVAYVPDFCSEPANTVGSWDIRVKSFEMAASGTDRSGLYAPQFGIFNLKINPAPLTLGSVAARKFYDGTRTVILGQITVSGAVAGETPTLDPTFAASATFADETAATGKAISLNGPFVLSSSFANDYFITNPTMPMTGSIDKATDVLKVVSSVDTAVLINGQPATPIDLTVTTTDVRTGQAPIAQAGAATPVLVSKNTNVCTVSGTTVTPVAAGDCVIQATQAASANYNAGISFHQSPSTTETVTIKIFASEIPISIVADDLKVAVGSSLNPSYSTTGVISGDSFDGVSFDYYQGNTLLSSAPTVIGTYRIVPKLGSLTQTSTIPYASVVKYIAGTLIITDVPPVITSVYPAHGPEVGGNTVVITGTGFGALTSISLGDKTLRRPSFTVNGDGTQVSFVAPPGIGGLDIALNAGQAEADTTYAYDAPYIPVSLVPNNGGTDAPPVVTAIAPASGPETGGNTVIITGTGLAALTSIVLGTTPIDVSGFTVNSDGTQVSFVAPAGAGTQDLTLVAGLLETTTTYTYHAAGYSAGGQPSISAPVIEAIAPAHGPEAGHNTVVITGSGFGALTGIMLGSNMLPESSYSINGDGTRVTLVMPPGVGTLRISLLVGQLHADAVYTYDTEAKGGQSSSAHIALMLDLAVGAKLSGQKVAINGGGLAPSSAYTLVLHSSPLNVFKGVTDASGNFDQKLDLQTKGLLPAGKHSLVLTGITPDGKAITQTAYFSLVDNDVVGATVETTSQKQMTLSGFLFAFRSSVLSKDAKRSLDHLKAFVKGAKSISIFGYTETDAKSAQVKVANFALAKSRALAVEAYLKSKGIVAKWTAIGKGGTNPVSVVDQYKNRRVVIQANF